jgi:hypothetical protein
MPLTEEYSDKVHSAVQRLKIEGGMTNENVTKAQKLLQYFYPNLEIDGDYGKETIKAARGFYKDYYWTEERMIEEVRKRGLFLGDEKSAIEYEMRKMIESGRKEKK